MKDIILLMAEVANQIHDVLIVVLNRMGFQLTDKDLHFWVIGLLGLATFFVVYFCFKFLEKVRWSTAIFSFIYTFTIMVVIVFAIEIQQGITNRGNMEFADAAIGLWGFLVFFMVYAAVALGTYFIYTFMTGKRNSKKNKNKINQGEKPTSRSQIHQK